MYSRRELAALPSIRFAPIDMLDLKREIKRLDEEDRKLKSEITCGQIQTVRIEASLVSLGEKLDRLGNEFSGLRGDIQKQLGSAAALEQVVKSFIEAHHAC